MPVKSDEFRAALSRFASGIAVVTTRDGSGQLYGITVSAFCSVSLEPPLVLICIEKATASHHAFAESRIFTASILSESQGELSEHFATENVDKFGVDETIELPNGLRAVRGASAVLECSLKFEHDAGDHTIFIGEVENVFVSESDPLVYFRGNYRKLEK